MRLGIVFAAGLFCLAGLEDQTHGADGTEPLRFQEVYDLVRTNLSGLSEADLEQAAAKGLISQLHPKTQWIEEGQLSSQTNAPLVSRVAVYEQFFGYLRVGQVAPGLAGDFEQLYRALDKTNRLKGIVIDLRFARGEDYTAAAQMADRFLATEKPLLNAGEGWQKSTAKNDAVPLPVAFLVNRQTAGAAEALAGVLRGAGIGLILGGRTAGQASVFKVMQLQTGQRLRVAIGSVRLGEDRTIPESGLVPDIEVTVAAEAEQAYFEDPFAVYPQPRARPGRGGAVLADQPRNEAELLRLFREGIAPVPGAAASPSASESPGPILQDPVLARAVDLLKGLAVVQSSREI